MVVVASMQDVGEMRDKSENELAGDEVLSSGHGLPLGGGAGWNERTTSPTGLVCAGLWKPCP